MFDKIKHTISTAGEAIKEQATSIGEAAKEKGFQIIDGWISNLPKLEAYGFKTTYFSMAVSINPTLEVEMQSGFEAFPLGRVEAILAENKGSNPINLVFTTIKTTLLLHEKARIEATNPMTVRIIVRISPEVRVSLGSPLIA
ncbi:MAG: hypothetical protein K9J37_00755 [Saprospiraceae bacterium]|nr:hypothetical protein [Saprospiraceae bacterium]MCF8248404.1 hypothetical protein [Saprospiraceae bacterium]MCF8280075.1 hypothetical protein [Bacteroidales bacterium]MCF8309932.1 hypothetical protein [Saprospiraceae bacterium]MCF8438737.1 hypothetical protein [Saprospiraceae bacterium]